MQGGHIRRPAELSERSNEYRGSHPALHQLLCGAIQNKRLIRCRYKDKEPIVEPHDYGIQKGIARFLSGRSAG